MTPIRVLITTECWREGNASETDNPIARALNQQQPVLRAQWHSSLNYVWLSNNPEQKVRLPKNVSRMMRLFKQGQREFRPLQFELSADRRELARGAR